MTCGNSAFLGVDLAWAVDRKSSAVAVLRGDERDARLVAVSGPLRPLSAIVDFIAGHAANDAVVAVDASLVVTNQTGQRLCETQIGQRFGRFGASCHSTNLGKPHGDTGKRLVDALADHGFRHDFDLVRARHRPGRWLFEVYPHPAMVELWSLNRIIAYKKGRVGQKREGLRILQGHLRRLVGPPFGLVGNEALETLLSRDVETLRGQALKDYEDGLDALFCAYLAWHCWRWGHEKNEMFGTLADGYIVVPSRGALLG